MRIGKRRPIGHIIERAVHEAIGPQAGRNYLYQHTSAAQINALPLPAGIGNFSGAGSQIGGGVDLTGNFILDFSVLDSADLIG